MANSINWFEIPVTDFQRAVKFYSDIFGFTMEITHIQGYDMGFFPMEPGSVSGAVVCGEGYVPSQTGTLVYLNGGEDLNEVVNKVEKAGGKVVVPKTQISEEIGYFARFIDSEGNLIAIHSPQ